MDFIVGATFGLVVGALTTFLATESHIHDALERGYDMAARQCREAHPRDHQ